MKIYLMLTVILLITISCSKSTDNKLNEAKTKSLTSKQKLIKEFNAIPFADSTLNLFSYQLTNLYKDSIVLFDDVSINDIYKNNGEYYLFGEYYSGGIESCYMTLAIPEETLLNLGICDRKVSIAVKISEIKKIDLENYADIQIEHYKSGEDENDNEIYSEFSYPIIKTTVSDNYLFLGKLLKYRCLN